MTSQGLMPARNAGLSSHRPGNFYSGHFEIYGTFTLSRNRHLRFKVGGAICPGPLV